MFWEGEKYPWGDMTNEARINLLHSEVFQKYSEEYVSHEPTRKMIREKYNIAVTFVFCSDPRLRDIFFNLVPGESWYKRGIGSIVNDADPLFRATFSRLLDKHEVRHLDHLYIQTYHFSKSDGQKCCAGQKYDADKARLSGEFETETARRIYRFKRFVYPILIGIETDLGEAIIHGYDGSMLRSSEIGSMSDDAIYTRLYTMFRDTTFNKSLPEKLKYYILERLIKGNVRYISEDHTETNEVLQRQHQFVLGMGTGLFAFPAGRVLIIPPFPLDKKLELIKGARLIRKVFDAGRIKHENGFILSTSTMFDNPDDWPWAAEETLRFARFVDKTIKKGAKDLYERMTVLPVIMNRIDRMTTIID
ncbi:MAG: hypothetical protein WCL23_00775 [Candidatus Moraniibacteriota bacterium]